MTTAAEGVETEAQMEHLARVRCTEVQGYLFSRRRPPADVPAMCRLLERPVMACSNSVMAGLDPARYPQLALDTTPGLIYCSRHGACPAAARTGPATDPRVD